MSKTRKINNAIPPLHIDDNDRKAITRRINLDDLQDVPRRKK